MGMLWTQDEDATLTKLWPKTAAGQIAGLLGKSRNAIIGRARRLNLSPKASRRPKAPPRPPVVKIKPVSVKPTPLTEPLATDSIPLLEARADQCKSVTASTEAPYGLAMVCGAPVPEGANYEFCSFHLSKYIQQRGS